MMEFFPSQRRKLEIADWQPLRNEQDEKRIRFDLLMPLTGQPYLSMPSFLAPSYEKMDLENSAIKDCDLTTQLDDVTLELYATDQSGPLEVEWGIGLDRGRGRRARSQKKTAPHSVHSPKFQGRPREARRGLARRREVLGHDAIDPRARGLGSRLQRKNALVRVLDRSIPRANGNRPGDAPDLGIRTRRIDDRPEALSLPALRRRPRSRGRSRGRNRERNSGGPEREVAS